MNLGSLKIIAVKSHALRRRESKVFALKAIAVFIAFYALAVVTLADQSPAEHLVVNQSDYDLLRFCGIAGGTLILMGVGWRLFGALSGIVVLAVSWPNQFGDYAGMTFAASSDRIVPLAQSFCSASQMCGGG